MESECSCDEIIIGTNEEFIFGYNVFTNKDGEIDLEQSFSNHAHIGRVKQVTICKNYLVTGSTDEFIKIFDLRNRKEIGSLNIHEGTINALVYHESGFLFSASEDGTIAITEIGKWKLRKELKGHTESVTGIAVHPSGKLALSISKDKRVITWNTMKGKKAYQIGLKKAGEKIQWSPEGSNYLISSLNIINIYSIEHGNIIHTIDFKSNIYCFCYLTNKYLIVGGEKKNLVIYDLESIKEIAHWEAHETRTKCLTLLSSTSEELIRFASASSDGFIKVWGFNVLDLSSAPRLLGKVNTESRIICMTIKPISSSNTNYKKDKKEKVHDTKNSALPSGKKNKKMKTKNKINKVVSFDDNTEKLLVNNKNLSHINKSFMSKKKKGNVAKDKVNGNSNSKNKNIESLKGVQKKVQFKKKVKKRLIPSNK